MRHLTVGVFQDEELGKELGKKGTVSDIAMYNRKTDECVFTFMSPVEEKLAAKSEIASVIDAAVVVFSKLTRELGETIIMLDLLGITRGVAVTSPYATSDQIANLTGDSSIKAFQVEQREPVKLLELLSQINPVRNSSSPVMVVLDHSFNVKGVGEVVLGFVRRGTIKKYDKLTLLPAGKEVLIRSIQVQDEDWDSADAGTRVGLAIKGASLDELERGVILTASNQAKASTKLNLSFSKNPFYAEDVTQGPYHATLAMQTNPVTISDQNAGSMSIESSKPFAFEPKDAVIMLDLNAKKTRIIGKGVVSDA